MDAIFWLSMFVGVSSAVMLFTVAFVRGLTKLFKLDIDIED